MNNSNKDLNMNTIDNMKIQNEYAKLFKKADMVGKFELKCWLDFCENRSYITFEEFLKTQSPHHFLDKLNCNMIDISDIGTKDDIEDALSELF